MKYVTFFEALIITHFIMDWLFQTKWEAQNKSRKWLNLLVHCFVYTIGFLPAFLYFNIDFLWLVFIFGTHVALDRRAFEIWWLEKIKRYKIKQDEMGAIDWILLIGVDQTFHLAALTIIIIFA